MSDAAFAALRTSSGFASDPRFAACRASPSLPLPEPEDPVALAWADGHAEGRAQALAEASARAEADEAARTPIELALARLDAELAEQLRQKLYATVEALCAAAIAPLALDPAALAARVERAAAMLARVTGLHRLLAAKYYIDELYEAVLGRPLTWLSDAVFLKLGDRTLLDGSLNGMAKLAHMTAGALSRVQTGNLLGDVFWVLAGSALCLLWSLRHG